MRTLSSKVHQQCVPSAWVPGGQRARGLEGPGCQGVRGPGARGAPGEGRQGAEGKGARGADGLGSPWPSLAENLYHAMPTG